MIYGDKTVLNANTGVADTYLCKAVDMNAIKTFAATGWYPITTEATLTYSSYSSTTKTGVVTTSATLAGLISVGMKMKFTQSSTVKYAIVTAITSTTITLFFGQNGGDLTNATITLPYWSTQRTPYGFPTGWYLELSSTTETSVALSENQVINIGDLSLTVPVGEWKISYSASAAISQTGSQTGAFIIGQFNLSTSSTAEQTNGTTFRFGMASTAKPGHNMAIKRKNITLTENTTYYLLFKALASTNTVFLQGTTVEPTIIRAECAYI